MKKAHTPRVIVHGASVDCVEDHDIHGFEMRDGLLMTVNGFVRTKIRVSPEPDRRPEGFIEMHGGDDYTMHQREIRNFWAPHRNTTDERRSEGWQTFEYLRPTLDEAAAPRKFWSEPARQDEVDYWAARAEVEDFTATCEAAIADAAWAFTGALRLARR
jgi:hypothetical protein